MTGLIDGDIVAYRCAASAEGEPPEIAIMRTDLMMREILQLEDNHITFLSGDNNFRYKINPDYKANRKDKAKPKHLEACRQFLLAEYKAVLTNGYEADDALGIHQNSETTIYSIDKDLLMIPGSHYNFVRKEYTEVSELDGLKTFYKQMLIGDVSDNIKGIDGIGKVKAGKLIDHLTTEDEMYEVVYDKYVATIFDDEGDKRFNMNANCLWIMRKENEKFSDRWVSLKVREELPGATD